MREKHGQTERRLSSEPAVKAFHKAGKARCGQDKKLKILFLGSESLGLVPFHSMPQMIENLGHDVEKATNIEHALEMIGSGNVDVLVTTGALDSDLGTLDIDLDRLVERVKEHNPRAEVIFTYIPGVGNRSGIHAAVGAVKAGVFDFLEFPLDSEGVAASLEKIVSKKYPPPLSDKMETGKGREEKMTEPPFAKPLAKFKDYEGHTLDFIHCFDRTAQIIFEKLNESEGRFSLELGEVLTSDRGYTIERFSLNDSKDENGTEIGFVEARKESDGTVSNLFISAPPQVLFVIKEMAESSC